MCSNCLTVINFNSFGRACGAPKFFSMMQNVYKSIGLIFFSIYLLSCSKSASDLEEAQTFLTTPDKWYIQEILIDDAPVFKEGKHIPHLSGIKFNVYMDWVSFKPNSTFEGHFKDSTHVKIFQWEAYPKTNVIALRDTITKTDGWNIYPTGVSQQKFEMQTRSTVYDPPRNTKVTLIFKK